MVSRAEKKPRSGRLPGCVMGDLAPWDPRPPRLGGGAARGHSCCKQPQHEGSMSSLEWKSSQGGIRSARSEPKTAQAGRRTRGRYEVGRSEWEISGFCISCTVGEIC